MTATRASAPIAATGNMPERVGVGRASAGIVTFGGVVVCTACPPDPIGGTTWTMYTETGCGPTIMISLSEQDDEEACPLTKVTVTLDPSFLPLYVDEALGGRSPHPVTRFPSSILTLAAVAVQVVPEHALQSGFVMSLRL